MCDKIFYSNNTFAIWVGAYNVGFKTPLVALMLFLGPECKINY